MTSQQSMHRRSMLAIPLILALLVFGLAPGNAMADTLDDVLSAAAKFGLVSKDVAASKPVIECLLGGGNAVTCANSVVNVQEEAQKMLPPTDPSIKLIVNLVQAVAGEQWLKVLELAGKSGASIACELVPGGAIKDFFCSAIAKIAQSKVEAVYGIIVEGDWWKLVTLIDPTTACELMPSDIRTIVCSGLLKAIGMLADVFEEGIGIIIEFFEGAAEVFTGEQDPAMSPEKFYGDYWRRKDLHWMVNEGLQKPGATIGVWPSGTHEYCVSYFDSHRMSEDDAKALCQKMGDNLHDEAVALKKLAVDSVPAYLKAALEPRRYLIAATWWQNIPGPSAPVLKTIQVGDLYKMCIYEVVTQLPQKYTGDGRNYSAPGSVPAWICNKAVYEQFYPQLPMAKSDLETKILAPLTQSTSKGRLGLGAPGLCKIDTNPYTPHLIVACSTYDKWRECRSIFRGMGIDVDDATQPSCLVDHLTAGKVLAEEVAADLGKRCTAKYTTIECTREWKEQDCYARIGDAVAGLPPSFYQPKCKYVSTPEYEAAKSQAREILSGLNGATPVNIGPKGQVIPNTVWPADKACYSLPDPLVLKCKGGFTLPEVSGTPLQYCKQDPNRDGMDAPCYLDLADAKQVSTSPLMTASPPPTSEAPAASARRELPLLPVTTIDAPPNPCRMEVSYYVPQAPEVSLNSSTLQINDQVQIECKFEKVTREIDWPQCDAEALKSMGLLKSAAESGGRFSGVVSIDGGTVGVTSSPKDGGDFVGTKIWNFKDAGEHEISCQVDNALRYAGKDAPTYLKAAVAIAANARSDDKTFGRFDATTARRALTNVLPSEASPVALDGRFRIVGKEGDLDDDRNPADAAVAVPSDRSVGRLVKPPVTEPASSGTTATPWNRLVLSCLAALGTEPKYGLPSGFSSYNILAENTSAKAIEPGQTIFWRAFGSTVSTTGFGGGGKEWTREGTYPVQATLPIGDRVRVGDEIVPGIIKSCEVWAQ